MVGVKNMRWWEKILSFFSNDIGLRIMVREAMEMNKKFFPDYYKDPKTLASESLLRLRTKKQDCYHNCWDDLWRITNLLQKRSVTYEEIETNKEEILSLWIEKNRDVALDRIGFLRYCDETETDEEKEIVDKEISVKKVYYKDIQEVLMRSGLTPQDIGTTEEEMIRISRISNQRAGGLKEEVKKNLWKIDIP